MLLNILSKFTDEREHSYKQNKSQKHVKNHTQTTVRFLIFDELFLY